MKKLSFFIFSILCSISVLAAESTLSIESQYSVKDTADRFEKIIKQKKLTLFARINHTQNASNVNLKLLPTEVIIFGNPKVGTPLMQCAQMVAIDLPQKALFWEDSKGKVWLSYNNPAYIKERHKIKGCDHVLKKISAVLNKLGEAATSK